VQNMHNFYRFVRKKCKIFERRKWNFTKKVIPTYMLIWSFSGVCSPLKFSPHSKTIRFCVLLFLVQHFLFAPWRSDFRKRNALFSVWWHTHCSLWLNCGKKQSLIRKVTFVEMITVWLKYIKFWEE
jgi:hypothetical protein